MLRKVWPWFARASAPRPGNRLHLESLEERLVLSPVPVQDSTDYPWRAVVRIETHFPNDSSRSFILGSGVLIDSFHVLTAGHVLYDATSGGWANQVRVFPAHNGALNDPFGIAYGTIVRDYHSFVQINQNGSYDQHDDIGLITLDRPIGNTTGWMSLGFNNADQYFTELGLGTAGYPAEQGYTGAQMYYQFSPIDGVARAGELLTWTYSEITAIPGQSGSPLWVYNPTTGQRTVYGVLVAGDDAGQRGYGVRLTERLYNDILNQTSQDTPPSSFPFGLPTVAGFELPDPANQNSGPTVAETTTGSIVGTDLGPTQSVGIGDFNPATGTWYLRSQISSGMADVGTFQFGAPGWTPIVGDWDGDGVSTIGVSDPTTSTFYLRNSNNSGPATGGTIQFGLPGWQPVVGDWNGDGRTTIGMFDPSTATFYLRNSNTAGAPDAGSFSYGVAGWKPLAGDWDHNGTSTVGVFNPASSGWYLRNENSAGGPDAGSFFYGEPNWQPITLPGNGGGTAIGVINPATLTWYVRDSASAGAPTTTPFTFGLPGWIGLSGRWTTASETPTAARILVPTSEEQMDSTFSLSPQPRAILEQPTAEENEEASDVFADVRRLNEALARRPQVEELLGAFAPGALDSPEQPWDKLFG